MARTHENTQTGRALFPALALAVLALALGLFGWRAVTTFTAPQGTGAASELETLVETVTGPGQARIAETANGGILVLVNGPPGTLSARDTGRIRSLVAAIHPSAPPPIVQQYVFATGTPGQPGPAALLELAGLALLAGLAGWLAMILPRSSGTQAAMPLADAPRLRSSDGNTIPAAPAPVPARAPATPVGQAAKLAERDPKLIASVIRTWLEEPGGHA